MAKYSDMIYRQVATCKECDFKEEQYDKDLCESLLADNLDLYVPKEDYKKNVITLAHEHAKQTGHIVILDIGLILKYK